MQDVFCFYFTPRTLFFNFKFDLELLQIIYLMAFYFSHASNLQRI
jgi:hypothetical protein